MLLLGALLSHPVTTVPQMNSNLTKKGRCPPFFVFCLQSSKEGSVMNLVDTRSMFNKRHPKMCPRGVS